MREDDEDANQSKVANQSEELPVILDSSDSDISLLTGKDNKDILGMFGDDDENQTDFMCEEWIKFKLNFDSTLKIMCLAYFQTFHSFHLCLVLINLTAIEIYHSFNWGLQYWLQLVFKFIFVHRQ